MKTISKMMGVIAVGLAATSAQAEEIVLKVAHFLPSVAPMHAHVIVPWCDKIAAESAGRMKCQIYPAMQLGGTPPQLLNQVRDGVADIVWTLPGYTPGRFPRSEVFELPFVSGGHVATARAYWEYVQRNAAGEFTGFRPIATWVNGPNVLHFRTKEVTSLSDLKGLKIRAPSRLGNKTLAALGAVPVGMPITQMAEGLSKGVIDGALLSWVTVPDSKTHELTRYHVEAGDTRALTTATMILVMNQKKYDSLPPDLKKVIDNNSGSDTSAWVAQQHVIHAEKGRSATLARGNTIRTLADGELAKWQAASAGVVEEWIGEIDKAGGDGHKLYNDAVALIKRYSANAAE